jgi:lysophospholipase L1-like esterase
MKIRNKKGKQIRGMTYEERKKSGVRAALLLCLMLCLISFFTLHTAAASSQKIALNKTTVSITKGRSVNLKLLNAKSTVSWSSSKKSVAMVSKTGKVVGVSKGTCTITARYKGKTYRCKVKVYNHSKEYLPSLLQKTYAASQNKGKVILAGSSSIEYWTNAASAFAPLKILNMGVAGTTVANWQKMYKNLIVKYKPSAVVLYVGSNDIGDGWTGESGGTAAASICSLIQKIQKSLPGVPVYYVSICPSLKRSDAWYDIKVCNRKMKAYCASKKNLYYIDVASYFWEDGVLDPELYASDMLHLSKEGYAIWEDVICPVVKKKLKAE